MSPLTAILRRLCLSASPADSSFNFSDIQSGLTRLGELAHADGQQIHLVVLGGAAMVLGYRTRESTKDVDVVILSPNAQLVRKWAEAVAAENNWPRDWLNDAAKGYVDVLSEGPVLVQSEGITASQPSTEQLLALKLGAWRGAGDYGDATELLKALAEDASKESVWESLQPFLQKGRELKMQYAFDDLWGRLHEPT